MPRFSIITINLNNYEGLKKTIESVLNQTFNDFEFLVIDGKSTDGSFELIMKHNHEIDYWVSERDNGIYHAMNKGLKKAHGDYCLFLNSGDWLYDNYVLERVFSFDFHDDIVYGSLIYEERGKLRTFSYPDPGQISFFYFLDSSLPHQCTFIKRHLFDIIGYYNESNIIVSDWEWFAIALFKHDCTLKKIDIPISFYDTTGISSNKSLLDYQMKEKRDSAEKFFPRILMDYVDYKQMLDFYRKTPKLMRKILTNLR